MGAGDLVEVGPPPVGFIWVIRDIRALSPQQTSGTYSETLIGLTVFDSNGIPFAEWSRPWLQGNRLYEWEGRQVIIGGMSFFVQSNDDGWSARVSGYTLSDPS